MDSCEECGFVYADLPVDEVAGRIGALGGRFRTAVVGASPAALTERPEPAVWSVLEYCCHLRDVLLVQRERVVLAQVEDRPDFVRMYRDERVDLCDYGAHGLEEVLDQLDFSASLCALAFARLGPPQWSRSLLYNWPQPVERDLAWLGRHTAHEGEHHLFDVRRLLGRA